MDDHGALEVHLLTNNGSTSTAVQTKQWICHSEQLPGSSFKLTQDKWNAEPLVQSVLAQMTEGDARTWLHRQKAEVPVARQSSEHHQSAKSSGDETMPTQS